MQLPEPSEGLVVLGELIRVLERRSPGLMNEMIADLEDDVLKSEIIRLRGPKVAHEMRGMIGRAHAWVVALRLVNRSTDVGRPARVKKKRFWELT